MADIIEFIKIGGDSGTKCAYLTPMSIKSYLSGADFDDRPDATLCFPTSKIGNETVGCADLSDAKYRAYDAGDYLNEAITICHASNADIDYKEMMMLRPICAMNIQSVVAVMYLMRHGKMDLDDLASIRLMKIDDAREWMMRRIDE